PPHKTTGRQQTCFFFKKKKNLQSKIPAKGEVLCLPSFATTTLIRRTVQRSTVEYARTSCRWLRRRRGLCATIGLILGRARAHPSASLRTKAVLMSRCAWLRITYKSICLNLLLRNPRLSKGRSKLTIKCPPNLSKSGWSWSCVSAIDSDGRTVWIADAHRDDGKCFVVYCARPD